MTPTTTITFDGGTAIRPFALTDSYTSEHASQHVRHAIVGGGAVFTLRPATPRTGKLSLLFDSEAAGDYARYAHTLATALTLVDEVRPALGMVYVASGRIRLALDPATLTHWVLNVDYEAIA